MILTIRPEQPEDISEIREVIKRAFKSASHSNNKEHHIVDALREHGQLYLSRVAEVDGQMMGHIAVSPVRLSSGAKHWYGIGPVSIIPDYQSKGGGSRLIESTLHQLKDSGANGCVLVGDPSYYTRFGFKHISTLTCQDIPQGYFMAIAFNDQCPRGSVTYPEAFS